MDVCFPNNFIFLFTRYYYLLLTSSMLFTYQSDVNIGRAGETKDTKFFGRTVSVGPPLKVVIQLIQLLHLKYSPILPRTYSPGWTQRNYGSIHPTPNFYSLAQNNNDWNFLNSKRCLLIGNNIIPVSSSARNLGFIFDSDMSFTDQINSLSESCHFHIRDIRRICHLFPLSVATALASSLVFSKLDYCNSLYNDISQAANTAYTWNMNTSHQCSKTYIGFQSKFEYLFE